MREIFQRGQTHFSCFFFFFFFFQRDMLFPGGNFHFDRSKTNFSGFEKKVKSKKKKKKPKQNKTKTKNEGKKKGPLLIL